MSEEYERCEDCGGIPRDENTFEPCVCLENANDVLRKENATLRSQLADVEVAMHGHRKASETAERALDKARREREEWETNSATIINGMAAESDGLRHRAEQAETALTAVTEARDHWQREAGIQQAHRERAEKVVEAARVQADAKRAWFRCGHRDPNCDHYHTYSNRCDDTEQAVYTLSTPPTQDTP